MITGFEASCMKHVSVIVEVRGSESLNAMDDNSFLYHFHTLGTGADNNDH
jgi:hypothetical protein